MDYPVIDPAATGNRIDMLRKANGITVNELRDYLGLSTTYAIYKWFHGDSMPSLDNMLALSILFATPINDMIVIL